MSRDADLDEEIRFHLEMRAKELVTEGLSPAEARKRARELFGDVERIRAACRPIDSRLEKRMKRMTTLSDLRQDLAYAARQLLHFPGFSVTAVLTLTLGIGATAAVFSALDAVVLRPLPFAEPERIALVSNVWREGVLGEVSAGNFVDIERRATSFESLACAQYSSFNLSEGDQPERIVGRRVSRSFFELFGVAPMLGRTFLPEEDEPGREHVALLSHRLWSRRFGADPGIVGRSIRLSDLPYTVVGVMPASFDYLATSEEIWVPIAFTPARKAMHDEHYLVVFGRLRSGAQWERAQAEVDGIARELAKLYPRENANIAFNVQPYSRWLVGDYRRRFFVLLGAVGSVLLIACANVANLLFARGASRAREIAVRAAVGAGRSRIVRQLLAESLLLAILGAASGVALASFGVPLLAAAAPPGIPRLDGARVDLVTLGFTLLIALGSCLVFGLAPALGLARPDLLRALREGDRSGGRAISERVRSGLVIVEVALTLTLLVGAGLLIRSAVHLGRIDPGFDPEGVLSARVSLPRERYATPAAARQAFELTVESLRSASGVRYAAVSSQVPLGPGGGSNGVIPENRPLDVKSAIISRLRIVTPEFFQTMRIPLKAGRRFTAEDRRDGTLVMIVSETLARQAFPGESVLGKRIACCEGGPDSPSWKTVVGVVGDVRSRTLTDEMRPEFYLPMAQAPDVSWDWIQRTMNLVARGDVPPEALVGAMRSAVRSVDSRVPLFNVATMEERHRDALAPARFNTLLLTTLGVLGLVLAAIGIYGVLAYFVNRRTHEIGVRTALGADSGTVMRLVLGQTLRPVLVGLALGATGALLAARLLEDQLVGVEAHDPLTFTAVVLLLSAVAFVASYVPARRATRVDPTRALADS